MCKSPLENKFSEPAHLDCGRSFRADLRGVLAKDKIPVAFRSGCPFVAVKTHTFCALYLSFVSI